MKSVGSLWRDVQSGSPPAQAATKTSLVAVVALDIHKKFSKAVVMSADCEILWEKKVSHHDKGELAEFFSRFEPGTNVVMEATFNWPWIADLAGEAGLRSNQ